jgi:hypothetical protein
MHMRGGEGRAPYKKRFDDSVVAWFDCVLDGKGGRRQEAWLLPAFDNYLEKDTSTRLRVASLWPGAAMLGRFSEWERIIGSLEKSGLVVLKRLKLDPQSHEARRSWFSHATRSQRAFHPPMPPPSQDCIDAYVDAYTCGDNVSPCSSFTTVIVDDFGDGYVAAEHEGFGSW